MSIESVILSNHLILCHPLLLLPSIFPSIRVFSSESALHIRWLKSWSFSFSISPPNQYSGLISFRTDWFYLLAVEGILKNLLQHHSSRASVLWFSAFIMVQLSHPYITTGEWFFQWSCMDMRVGLWRKLSSKELMLLNCGVGEDSWESLGLQGDPTSPS